MHRQAYQCSATIHNNPLEPIHSDLWGSSPITSHNGFQYYVSFIDHSSRLVCIYLLKHKNEVHDVFIQFKTLVEGQLNTKLNSIQTD